MQFDDEKRREQIALFRYGVIAELIHLPRGKGSGLYDKLRDKAARDWRSLSLGGEGSLPRPCAIG